MTGGLAIAIKLKQECSDLCVNQAAGRRTETILIFKKQHKSTPWVIEEMGTGADECKKTTAVCGGGEDEVVPGPEAESPRQRRWAPSFRAEASAEALS